jgi:hypothetical protein
MFSLLGAVSLYYRDIFSVAKDKNQTDLPEVKLMTIYVYARLELDFNYYIVCFECFCIASVCIFFQFGRVLYPCVVVTFEVLFSRDYTFTCLVDRDIC